MFGPEWDAGTVTARFVWSHGTASGSYGVAWGLQAVARGNSDPMNTTFGTAVVTTDTGGTTNDNYISAESSPVTIGGNPTDSDLVIFRVFRDVSAGGDTLAVDARLQQILLFVTTDQAVA